MPTSGTTPRRPIPVKQSSPSKSNGRYGSNNLQMHTVKKNMDNTNTSRRISRRFVALAMAALSFGLTFATGCSSKGFTGPNAFVTIVPGNTMVGTGATFVLFAGASPTGVNWAITSGTGCTGVACGTLAGATATSVNYIAPVTIPASTMSVTITATSTTNSSSSASETLTVFPVYVQITGPVSYTHLR